MRNGRRLLVAAAGVPLVAVAVLGIEVEVARRGENLDDVELTWSDGGSVPVVWLGDSTAYGVGVDDGAETAASLIAKERNERVTNLAVSGATLADVGDDQLPAVAELRPERVYLSVGANDVTHLTRVGSFADDYRALLDGLPRGIEVVVLGVPDMGAPPRLAQPLRTIAGWRGRRLDVEVRRAVARAVAGDRVTYVDIEGRTGPVFRRDPGRYFAGDGYHPSADGYQRWADAVLATIDG